MFQKRHSTMIAPLVAALALAACSVNTESDVVVPDPVPSPSADACGSAAYQQYVGQKSPAISLPAGTDFRHYRSGDPVTMDLRPDRINFE